MPMDHEWFKTVNQRLAELELQKAQRYGLQKGTIDRELHLHPMISSSRYWHRSDETACSECFDWSYPRFPGQYLRYIQRETKAMIDSLAMRPYYLNVADNMMIENQKTLMARIIMLNLVYLLPKLD